MIEPKRGTILLRLSGFYKNIVDEVEYLGMFRKVGYHNARMIKEKGGHESSYTLQSNHLFLLDGTDIHTGEMTEDIVILRKINERTN